MDWRVESGFGSEKVAMIARSNLYVMCGLGGKRGGACVCLWCCVCVELGRWLSGGDCLVRDFCFVV